VYVKIADFGLTQGTIFRDGPHTLTNYPPPQSFTKIYGVQNGIAISVPSRGEPT